MLPEIVSLWYLLTTSTTSEWFILQAATACKDDRESLSIKKCFFLVLLTVSRARSRPVSSAVYIEVLSGNLTETEQPSEYLLAATLSLSLEPSVYIYECMTVYRG